VIVDAAFLRADERADFHALAAGLGVPFAIVDCRAPLPVLRERLERRNAEGADPSEADAQVLEGLRVAAEPLDDAERALAITVDAGESFSATALARRWLGTPAG